MGRTFNLAKSFALPDVFGGLLAVAELAVDLVLKKPQYSIQCQVTTKGNIVKRC